MTVVPHALPQRTAAAQRLLAGVLAVATASGVSGCGSDPDGYDEADVAYASDVTSHHARTLQVLDLSLGRQSLDPELGALAEETRERLFAEVEVTRKWLKRNGEPVPETALDHTHPDERTYDTSIPGVLPEERLHELETADDRGFQAAWLDALVAQEEGAVELAETAVQDAENAEIVEVAESDLAHHERQLARLRELAGGGAR